VGVQLSLPGLYRPPVFNNKPLLSCPPQTIISLPVQTVVCQMRPWGALVVLVAIQLSVLRLYFPPVLKAGVLPSHPPQMIISLPAKTAV